MVDESRYVALYIYSARCLPLQSRDSRDNRVLVTGVTGHAHVL